MLGILSTLILSASPGTSPDRPVKSDTLQSGTAGDSQFEFAVPRLVVWTSNRCLPCRAFWQEFHSDTAFREAIRSHFRLTWVDVDDHRATASAHQIHAVPTFELGDRRITGYFGRQWLWRRLTTDVSMSGDGASRPALPTDGPPADTPIPPLPPLSRLERPREPSLSGSESTPSSAEAAKQAPEQVSSGPTRSPRGSAGGLKDLLRRSVPLILTRMEAVGLVGSSMATGGIGTLAVITFLRFVSLRRARRNHRSGRSADGEEGVAANRAPFPRSLDEAGELLAIRRSEGRVAALDALRGMFVDDELTKLAASENEIEAAIADRLKAAIDTRVDEVALLSTRIE